MPRATVSQCAVLVGGLGTRLGSLTATTPKPLLPCGDRPFLAWLLREMIRFGVTDFLLLTGHLSDQVAAAAPAIQASLPREARITISQEPVRAGTGGAVFHAANHLHDRFLLCNGDSLLDCNLANLLAAAAADDAGVTGRMLLRELPDASRFGVVQLDADRITGFRDRPAPGATPPGQPGAPGTINAGIYLFNRRLLDALSPDCSLETDIMPRLAAAGALRGTVADGYFRDIGFEWTPGALDTIRHATQSGWHVFVVTNQSGVARGYYDEQAVRDLLDWMSDEARRAGGTIDDTRYCPFHEAATVEAYRRAHPWRKPEPGMLLDLIRAWELDPARCVMIGDQPTDMAAAAAAGIPGHMFPGGNLLDFARPVLAG